MAKINKAELRTVREFLGYTGEDLATIWGVTERTIRRWEEVRGDAASNIPDEFAQALLDMVDWFNDTADEAIGAVLEQAETFGKPEAVDLRRYINDAQARYAGLEVPAGVHAALQGYIYAQLRAEGITARIDWVPTED